MKLFLNLSILLKAKEHNLNFKIARVALSINISFYDGKSEKQNMHFNPLQKFVFTPQSKPFCRKDPAFFQNYKNTLAMVQEQLTNPIRGTCSNSINLC